MIKQALTPERTQKVYFSLQKLSIMAKVMEFEHMQYLDADFRIPHVNNFMKRIGTDCKQIQDHLAKSGRIVVKNANQDFVDDYSGQMWRVMDLLIGLDAGAIKEFADNLEKELEAIGV